MDCEGSHGHRCYLDIRVCEVIPMMSDPEVRRHAVNAVLRFCSGKVRRWPVPPNWTLAEWMREVAAMGAAAAYEACCQFDPSRGADATVFVTSRVMGRVLTRYRQEWSFAVRFEHWSENSPEPMAIRPVARPDWGENLRDAVDRLPEVDRWLVSQIFWHDRDQSDLAHELGISQPAVSKRYKKIVRQLRCRLSLQNLNIAS
jgi:DNA-directed RNA polymerase specialized sigma24 family protein